MIHETINPLVNVIKGLTDQLNRSQPHTTAGASSSVVGGAVLASATIGIPLAGAGAATSAELTENENSVAIDHNQPRHVANKLVVVLQHKHTPVSSNIATHLRRMARWLEQESPT